MRKRTKSFEPDPVQMLTVYTPGVGGRSTVCVGFILTRGKAGYEEFDADGRSLGVFLTVKGAADVLSGTAS
jgi:hypothetical protein